MVISEQDVINYDIDNLASKLISPIDAIRSKSSSTGYIESRLNAFYRMIGFPVVNSATEFFSPGFDLELNTSKKATDNKNLIIKNILNNNSIIYDLLEPREYHPKKYSKVFSSSGLDSTFVAIGSANIRSFKDQFSGTPPLEFDKSQKQKMTNRISAIEVIFKLDKDNKPEQYSLYESALSLLTSTHLLKPFIVDPRIQVYPDTNLVSAPFPKDASVIKQFSGGSYKRPYIERVISLRLDTKKPISPSISISKIIEDIKNDNNIMDKTLLKIANNAQSQSINSDLAVFYNHLILLRSIIDSLISAIKDVEFAINKTNFQPIPNSSLGVEGGCSVNKVVNDDNNKEIELNILELYNKISFKNFSSAEDVGLNDNNSSGGFEFSQIDDLVFSSDKVAVSSDDENLKQLISERETIINEGSDALRKIELIMGEFSGLGLIDIVAIQSAFWLIDTDKLLGLIDNYSYERLKKYRPNIGASTGSRNDDVIACLADFEEKLTGVYNFIQLYYDEVLNGKAYESK